MLHNSRLKFCRILFLNSICKTCGRAVHRIHTKINAATAQIDLNLKKCMDGVCRKSYSSSTCILKLCSLVGREVYMNSTVA